MSLPFDPERFRAILDQEGLPGPRGQNGRSLIFRCPLDGCGSKMVVEKHTGHYTCYNCRYRNDAHGTAEHLLSRLLRCSIAQARERLYDVSETILRTYLPPVLFLEEDDEAEDLLPTRSWEYHMIPILDPRAVRGAAYLEGRGIPPAIAAEYGTRYSPVLRQVIFPVEVDQRLVGWQGRIVYDERWTDEKGETQRAVKSPSSRGIPREHALMFQDRVTGFRAVLGEGPVDAMKAHLVGGNVNSMGKVVSDGQMGVLLRKGVRCLFIAQDPDAADTTMRLVRSYSSLIEVRRLVIPARYKDMGEMAMDDVPHLLDSSERCRPWQMFFYFGTGAAKKEIA